MRVSLTGLAIAWLPMLGCSTAQDGAGQTTQAVGTPSVDQVPLDPTTIPSSSTS